MSKINFKLDAFEGPLDLLLHLIYTHKLDIYNVEISKLFDQYMDYISIMKENQFDISIEFLEMAAKLVYMKTVALLPKTDEIKKLKNELTGILLEYNLCKIMANKLKLMYNDSFFTREPQPKLVNYIYNRNHSALILKEKYYSLIKNSDKNTTKSIHVFKNIVSKKMVSVTSKVIYILKKLYRNGSVSYDEFFYLDDKSELVATFVALLELIKSKRIVISQDNKMVYFNSNI